MLEAQNVFKRHFGYTPTHVVRAPGRLELLGNHADENGGLVLTLAIDRFVYVAASPRTDGRIEWISSAFPEPEKSSISEFKKNPSAPWSDYMKGVLGQLRKRGAHIGGFNAAVHSTLPMGMGLGSSAALQVATALIARELFPYTITDTGVTVPPRRDSRNRLRKPRPEEKMNLARICHAAETQFVGAAGRLSDPISSLFGRAFHAVEIDCLRYGVNWAPMIGEIGLVICPSGVTPDRAAGGCQELRETCAGVARKLGVKSLRAIDLKTLSAGKTKLTEREYECGYHIVGENQRAIFGERALREDDFFQFGQYLFQSHESSRDFFRNSTPDLDLLVDLGRTHPGTLGARLTGAGFGGATVNLVRRDDLKNFMQFMSAEYGKRTGRALNPFLCQVVDGAD